MGDQRARRGVIGTAVFAVTAVLGLLGTPAHAAGADAGVMPAAARTTPPPPSPTIPGVPTFPGLPTTVAPAPTATGGATITVASTAAADTADDRDEGDGATTWTLARWGVVVGIAVVAIILIGAVGSRLWDRRRGT